jgi:hypothetical protein
MRKKAIKSTDLNISMLMTLVKVTGKVQFVLDQATKAQRDSRVTALLFL